MSLYSRSVWLFAGAAQWLLCGEFLSALVKETACFVHGKDQARANLVLIDSILK